MESKSHTGFWRNVTFAFGLMKICHYSSPLWLNVTQGEQCIQIKCCPSKFHQNSFSGKQGVTHRTRSSHKPMYFSLFCNEESMVRVKQYC